MLSDAIYGHEYEFKGIKAPTSYQLADKSKAYKVEADEETDTIIYYFEGSIDKKLTKEEYSNTIMIDGI